MFILAAVIVFASIAYFGIKRPWHRETDLEKLVRLENARKAMARAAKSADNAR